ncbi:right-handed parallel beta-helix repeat-containing protein [Halegenticoccus soli]|uniref:right-handed parallel beta-helix repeat-containing protein n=1 Tax=Halegenticoccus soli TaxID=1985678 RepID=UPI000C6CB70A|nr:NosD domain-containing protein [Halegenticoccus soli]
MQIDRPLAAAVACALLLLAGCQSVVPPDAGQSDAGIDSCTEITEPGRYELTADIEDAEAGRCIRIRTSDVVLDGGGHRVDGVGSFGTAGIVAGSWERPVSNVTVRNVEVTGWDDGVRYVSADGGRIAGTTTADNRIGVLLVNSSGNDLVDNVARGNAVHGVEVADESDGNRLSNNTAASNALFGIHLVGGAGGNELSNNAVRGNQMGLALVSADGNAVRGTAAEGNRIAGAWLSAADDNVLADNRLSNRFYGVMLADGSENNTLSNNTAAGNAVGIRLRFSANNTVADNVVTDSRAEGILLISSDGNAIVGNTVADNLRGIVLLDSRDNRLSNNDVRSNRRGGIIEGRGGERDERAPGEG